MEKLEIAPMAKIVRVTGNLEMSFSDQEDLDAKYSDVDLVFIGSPKQLELVLNRLNAGYDGGVDTEELAPPVDGPTRPVRELARGDWVEWRTDNKYHEGMFLYADGGFGWVHIRKGQEARVPLQKLHYVDSALQSRSATVPDRRLKHGDPVRWKVGNQVKRGKFDYMRTQDTAYVLQNGLTIEIPLVDLQLDVRRES